MQTELLIDPDLQSVADFMQAQLPTSTTTRLSHRLHQFRNQLTIERIAGKVCLRDAQGKDSSQLRRGAGDVRLRKQF
jgi:hypothetical protein